MHISRSECPFCSIVLSITYNLEECQHSDGLDHGEMEAILKLQSVHILNYLYN